MTPEEAQTIARIAGTADGGCPNCVSDIVERLNKAELGYVWTMTDETYMEPAGWYDDPQAMRVAGLVVQVRLMQPEGEATPQNEGQSQ